MRPEPSPTMTVLMGCIAFNSHIFDRVSSKARTVRGGPARSSIGDLSIGKSDVTIPCQALEANTAGADGAADAGLIFGATTAAATTPPTVLRKSRRFI